LEWRVYPASKFGGYLSRVNPAGCHGKLFWRVISAGYFWRVILAHLFGGFSWPMKQAGSKEKKAKKGKENV
jgi:hypothetical protein